MPCGASAAATTGCRKVVDLSYGWAANRTIAPATELNGSYTGHSFSDRTVQLIRDHDAERPLFLFVALHNTHAPIEAPPEYAALYNYTQTARNEYYGQVSFVDSTVANISAALHAKGLWDNTLFVWTTDNGSPVNSAGSNDPFRGGKGSLWEGAYRVPGFIGGGLLPVAKRGTKMHGVIHISDWWPTFAALARLEPVDSSGPTPLDGVDQSQYIMGGSGTPSPRTEVVLDHLMHCVPGPGYDAAQCVRGQTPDFPAGHYPNHTAGALLSIQGDGSGKIFKLIVGPAAQASWYGHWPTNGTKTNYNAFVGCWPRPCLYEVGASDPSEHVDLAASEPAVLARMLARFKELESSYHPDKTNPPSDNAGACAALEANGNFLKPWK